MLKLLIVDDEEIICSTISNLIDWTALGIELIGTCLDGVEAYHTILDETPDIVMTDIRMPGISGLDLIERIRQTDLSTQFIILSGYEEFDYAKKAMRNGVKHYLLKPCDEAQIISCIQEVASEYQSIQFANKASANHNHLLKEFQLTLMQNIINEAISLEEIPDQFFDEYEQYLDFTDTTFQIIYLYYLEESNLDSCINKIFTFFIQNAPELPLYLLHTTNTLLLFFPDYAADYSKLDSFLQNLSFPAQAVAISCERKSYVNLKLLMLELVRKLRRYDIFYFITKYKTIPYYNYGRLLDQTNRLMIEICSLDAEIRDAAMEEIRTLFSSISNRDFMLQLSNRFLINLGTQFDLFSVSDLFIFLSKLQKETNNQEISTAVLNKIEELISHIDSTNSEFSPFIAKTLEYLKEHVADENITLKWIAEHVLYMNSKYVSRCFIKETHEKFSSYLMKLRIEKAKELLSNPDFDKIQNVAELVGCGNNPYYFSKIFKKYTGMTPSAYLHRIQK